MAKARRRKRFRRGNVSYKVSKGNREVRVKYLNRVKISGDTVLLFRLLRGRRRKRKRSN